MIFKFKHSSGSKTSVENFNLLRCVFAEATTIGQPHSEIGVQRTRLKWGNNILILYKKNIWLQIQRVYSASILILHPTSAFNHHVSWT